MLKFASIFQILPQLFNIDYFVNKSNTLFKKSFFFVCFLVYTFSSLAQVEFVENKGQWPNPVKYKGSISNGAFYLEQNGFSVVLHDPKDMNKISSFFHGHDTTRAVNEKDITLHSFSYKVSFEGSSSNPILSPEKALKTYHNYYIGNDPKAWASGCKLFQAVTYKNIYPGIDVRYYSEGDKLKYDFIVHPGANPNLIRMKYEGPEKMLIDKGNLIIKTSIGDVTELFPFSYQLQKNGEREKIGCRFVLSGKEVRFDLKAFDRNQLLVIDPAIIFSSFTGSTADNWGYTATPGPDGSFFSGGVVFGAGYPVSTGAYQTTFGGGQAESNALNPHDICIFKFTPNGADRLYATYLGGSGNEQPHSMICDAQGNLVIAGRSFSPNYPTTVAPIGPGGANDIILTKFNATGTALIGSIKIGGSANDGVNIRSKYENPDGADRTRRNYGDDARSEVILDRDNNVILASCTQSSDFPTLGNSLNNTGVFGGGLQDGLVLKFDPTLNIYRFGSFFGGTGDEACFVASPNPTNGNIYVAGGTTGAIPGNKIGVLQPTYQGGETDGFITELRPDLSGIVRSTYLGTNRTDQVYGLKFDKNGFPYAMGTTTGTWPVLNATYSNPGSSQFITKLRPDLSARVYSTVFGNGLSDPNISPIGFLVDRCENVYVTGWGGSINNFKNYTTGNTNGLPLQDPLSAVGAPDGEDFYFFVLKRDAQSLLFASNFGQFRGNTGDHVDGGTSRFDENGTIYQSMCANCNGGATFPTTPGAWRRINGSSNCNEAAVKVEMNFAGVDASARPTINSVVNDSSGCVPFRVDFTDTLQKAKTMYWDFGNGLKDTTTAPNFSTFTNYQSLGTFTVRVIAEDSTTCNIRDTAFLTILSGGDIATLDFTVSKDSPCTNLSYSFINRSTATSGNFTNSSFVWDYGDGSPLDTSFNGQHTFPSVGIYNVTLKLINNQFCNAPISKTKEINVNPLVKADFKVDTLGCAPYNAVFTNLSNTTNLIWQFSDGTTSTAVNPVKLFSQPGSYTVRLIAIDSNTCNKRDTTDFITVRAIQGPDAFFNWSPDPPVTNTPVSFSNGSNGAVRYQWNFGDGESSTETNPEHLYLATGSYNAQLIATNSFGCTDTFTRRVNALIEPLLDVPNAFTPGRFGENGVIKVIGFGVAKMDWRIYNRWGQLVFRSSNVKNGWDGTFKGKLQPMEVYAFTLDVTFSDGRKVKRKGDITLIR
jgi:gliding motility-associated-like protein